MPPKKKRARKQRRASPASATNRRLYELAEALDIMLPELTARLAAVEHLLVEKRLCTHDDLVRSREFVDLRRSEH